MKNLFMVMVLVVLLVVGCASSQTVPSQPPASCEKAFFYNQGKAFLPYGPALIRAGVATAMLAKPEAKPVVAMVCLTMWDAFKADYPDLVKINAVIQTKVKEAVYAGPALAALQELLPQIGGGQYQMTACDKNILMSLVKNIGLDAGADPSAFL